jgi:hypothetical protein
VTSTPRRTSRPRPVPRVAAADHRQRHDSGLIEG